MKKKLFVEAGEYLTYGWIIGFNYQRKYKNWFITWGRPMYFF